MPPHQVHRREAVDQLERELPGDAQLAGKDWLTGSRSIAVPYLFVTLRWAKGTKVDLSGLNNLERFFQQMHADAGVQESLEAEGLA